MCTGHHLNLSIQLFQHDPKQRKEYDILEQQRCPLLHIRHTPETRKID